MMCIGVSADHDGIELKVQLTTVLKPAGYQVANFNADKVVTGDGYPDFEEPLGRAVASGDVAEGPAICGGGVRACVAANKVPSVWAALERKEKA